MATVVTLESAISSIKLFNMHESTLCRFGIPQYQCKNWFYSWFMYLLNAKVQNVISVWFVIIRFGSCASGRNFGHFSAQFFSHAIIVGGLITSS